MLLPICLAVCKFPSHPSWSHLPCHGLCQSDRLHSPHTLSTAAVHAAQHPPNANAVSNRPVFMFLSSQQQHCSTEASACCRGSGLPTYGSFGPNSATAPTPRSRNVRQPSWPPSQLPCIPSPPSLQPFRTSAAGRPCLTAAQPPRSSLMPTRFPPLLPHHPPSVNADTRWSAIGFAVMTLLLLPWTLTYYIGKNLIVALIKSFPNLSMLSILHEHPAASAFHAVPLLVVLSSFLHSHSRVSALPGQEGNRLLPCPSTCLDPSDKAASSHR